MKIKYCFLQGFYWMLFCIGGGFVTAYLTGVGISAATVGIITAVFCGLSALLQPILGKIADKQGTFRWGIQVKCIVAGIILCNFLLYLQEDKVLSGFLCGVIILGLNCAMPFINGASFYYENRGISMNYGLARGCGSLFYAVMSLILGNFIKEFGIRTISISGMIVGAILFVLLFAFPCKKEGSSEPLDKKNRQPSAIPVKGNFFKQYPVFTRMLLGVMSLFIFHNITNTYLLQMLWHVGGGSKEMGVTLAMAAMLELPVMFGFSYIIKRFKSSTLLMISGICFVLKALMYVMATSVIIIYAAQILQMFSYALLASTGVYYAQEVMDEEHKLQGQAYQSSATTLGSVFGNLIGGVVLQKLGVTSMLIVATMFAGIGCAIMCIGYKESVKAK